MEILTSQNTASIRLASGESFFFKPSLLRGYASYDWAFPPPFPWGSPFMRFYHRVWLMKEVHAENRDLEIGLYGDHHRGNFKWLHLNEGDKMCIAVRSLAGFSHDLKNIHTQIRVGPAFWLFHEHFFSIFEGPGDVLLYGESFMEETANTEFDPHRLIAFNARKAFRPISPQPKKWFSQVINLLFSHEVIWQFEESGEVWAENCSDRHGRGRGGAGGFLKHLLGFFRI